MRIGIVPDLRSSAGGVYQYSITMLNALKDWSSHGCMDEFVVLTSQSDHPVLQDLKASWSVKPAGPPSFKSAAKRMLARFGLYGKALEIHARLHSTLGHIDVDAVQSRPEDRHWLKRLGLEMMLYPTPNRMSFEVGLPYIMAIHDLQHRLQPEFPEVSANNEWNNREYLFRNGGRNALIVLADSEAGKEDILNFYGQYGVRAERVKVLPFLPASYLPVEVSEEDKSHVRQKYELPDRFLFYPAQFWPHKNHARIVRALGVLRRDRNIEPPIVFCGSSEGAIRRNVLKEVNTLADGGGIEKQLVHLGYVPDADMGALYASAAALVMPTFFGPTNIPVLEAWRFGCPVITSDIRGIREQVGNAAVLVDPRSVEAIADAIEKVWTDDTLSKRLAQFGRERLSGYTPADFQKRLVQIIEQAKAYGTS
jgi:glycosyltransferase involved in cell wall biosynthesis